jgi:hypothetical protein
MSAESLNIQDYQLLLDKGWRRFEDLLSSYFEINCFYFLLFLQQKRNLFI